MYGYIMTSRVDPGRMSGSGLDNTNKFDGCIIEISFVDCLSYQNNRFNKHLEFIIYFH